MFVQPNDHVSVIDQKKQQADQSHTVLWRGLLRKKNQSTKLYFCICSTHYLQFCTKFAKWYFFQLSWLLRFVYVDRVFVRIIWYDLQNIELNYTLECEKCKILLI